MANVPFSSKTSISCLYLKIWLQYTDSHPCLWFWLVPTAFLCLHPHPHPAFCFYFALFVSENTMIGTCPAFAPETSGHLILRYILEIITEKYILYHQQYFIQRLNVTFSAQVFHYFTNCSLLNRISLNKLNKKVVDQKWKKKITESL